MPTPNTGEGKKAPQKKTVSEKGTKIGSAFAEPTDDPTVDMKDVEIFEAGTQTDSKGNEIDWTPEMLKEIADNYNAANPDEKNVAPAVLGHPEEGTYPSDDAPAYGWLHNVRVVGDKLVGDFRKCVAEFVEWVKNENYPNRSISITKDMNIAHVGFLGAVAPAVKTLAPVQFKFKVNKEATNYTFAVGDATTPVEDTPATEAASSSRTSRSTQYGISVVAGQGYDEKPTRFADLTDEDFADPVNYRFPLTEELIDGSVRVWGKDFIQEQYSESDRQKIGSRLIIGMVKYGYSLPSYWCYKETAKGHSFKFGSKFLEVPAELLSKTQLVKVINGNTQTTQQSTPNNLSTTKKEFAVMPTLEQLQAIMQKLLDDANAGLPTDAATMYAPWHKTATDEIAALFTSAGGETPLANNAAPVAPVITQPAFADSAEFKAMQKELEILKIDKRMNEHSQFAKSALDKGQILPFQIDNVIQLREALHEETPKTFEFSQGTGKVKANRQSAFDMFVGSLNQFNYSESATGERAINKPNEVKTPYEGASSESATRYTEVKNFMATDQGKNLTFEQAAKVAPKGAR